MNQDIGLTKKGLLEVQAEIKSEVTKLNNLFRIDIGKLKNDVDKRLDRMEKYQTEKWEEMNQFKRSMYENMDSIQDAILAQKYETNWKTSTLIFLSSALPTAIGVTYFLLKG